MNSEIQTDPEAREEPGMAIGGMSANEMAVERGNDDDANYLAVSKAAAASVGLVIVGTLGSLVSPFMLVLLLLAMVLGWIGLRNIKNHPEELCGRGVAMTGLMASMALFVSGASWYTYEYYTEVPEGYQRLGFWQLAFDENLGEVPDGIKDLEGSKVFIKGYVHPGVDGYGKVKQFVLVKDMGICCFGGQPKMSDMVEVEVKIDDGVKYSRRLRRLGGTLHVSNQPNKIGDINTGVYKLVVDYIN